MRLGDYTNHEDELSTTQIQPRQNRTDSSDTGSIIRHRVSSSIPPSANPLLRPTVSFLDVELTVRRNTAIADLAQPFYLTKMVGPLYH
jgi:hypothetical protein